MHQKYLQTKQVGQLLGVSVSTLKRLRKKPNGIPWTKVNGLIRYNIDDVKNWMKDNSTKHKRDVEFL